MRRLAARAATAFCVSFAVLVGEVMWTVHRRLPTSVGLDASGRIAGRVNSTPLHVVVLGDSTNTGPGLSGPDEIWFRQALADLDLDRPVDLVSMAVGGSRAADVLDRVDDAIAAHPDLVILSVGSNDAIHGTPSRRFEETYEQLISRLSDAVPTVAAANVGNLGNIARVPAPLASVLATRSRVISRKIEKVLERHRVALLDVTLSDRGFRDRTVFGPDLFHPNAVGHSLWAAAAVPGLRAALRLDAPVDPEESVRSPARL